MFIVTEHHLGRCAMFQLDLVTRNRLFAASNLSALLNYTSYFGTSFILSFYLQRVLEMSLYATGLVLLSMPVVMSVLSPISGWISDKVGSRVLASTGMFLMAAGLLLMSTLSVSSSAAEVVAWFVLMGVGMGLFASPNTSAIMGCVERDRLGVASGTLSTMRTVGQSMSLAIMGALIATATSTELVSALFMGAPLPPGTANADFVNGMALAFRASALIAVAGGVISLARGGRAAPTGADGHRNPLIRRPVSTGHGQSQRRCHRSQRLFQGHREEGDGIGHHAVRYQARVGHRDPAGTDRISQSPRPAVLLRVHVRPRPGRGGRHRCDAGESMVMLHSAGVDKGYIVLRNYIVPEQLAPLVKGTVLEGYEHIEDDAIAIRERLLEDARRWGRTAEDVPGAVPIDHFFNVKGVGTVILGMVARGVIRRHDTLTALPGEHTAQVRSIQKHDDDFDMAAAGDRVGLALKNITVDELDRGMVLSADPDLRKATELSGTAELVKFWKHPLKEGMVLHVGHWMQFVPARVTSVDGEDASRPSVTLSLDRPLVHPRAPGRC